MVLADWMRVQRVSLGGRAEVGGRRIYILPTKYGVVFGVLLFLMLLGAVNYGNNPAHLLTFLLGGIASNAIYLTWRNLRGLQLACLGAAPVFAGQTVRFIIDLSGGAQERPAIQLTFEHGTPVLLDLPADQTKTCELLVEDLPRGLQHPGRLVISTRYPLGLFRAWCQVECERPALVYPRPGPPWTPSGSDAVETDGIQQGEGNEDFAGLRSYQIGDQPSRIDWKSFARDRGLNTRLFSGQGLAPVWLDWEAAPGSGTEARLSALTRAVVDADGNGQLYALSTPSGRIAPGRGPRHRHQCLRRLALHGTQDV